MSFKRSKLNQKKRPPFFTIILVCALIFAGFYTYSNYTHFSHDPVMTEGREIIIESGDTLQTISKKIPELQSFWYNMYLKFNTPDLTLAAGRYKIDKGETLVQIFESLKEPITNETNITLLEGWNIFDIDARLTDKGLINEGAYIAYVRNKEKIEALSEFFPFLKLKNLENLEGFLYPDTYRVRTDNFQINQFVIRQLENFENRVYNKLFKDKYDNTTIYDIINLAAIVEKEEQNPDNKAMVAGILKKRLKSNWMIGADATVCYPHELTSQECKMVISKYIREKSEYNTRTMKGLPKTPIASPSYDTINKTLNDEKSEYWYYLHNVSTGQIFYGKNEAEHQYNIKNHMR